MYISKADTYTTTLPCRAPDVYSFSYHLRDLAVKLTLLQFEQSLLGPSAQS